MFGALISTIKLERWVYIMNDLWLQFLTTMLGSGAAIGLLNVYSVYKAESIKRRDEVGLLATRIAVQLEGYIIQCTDDLSNHEIFSSSKGSAGTSIQRIPKCLDLFHGDSYRLLDRDLLDDILQFPQKIQMAEQELTSLWEVTGDTSLCERRMYRYAVIMGREAVTLSRRLRTRYKLPVRKLVSDDRDMCEFLDTLLSQIEDEDSRRELAHSQWMSLKKP